MFATARTRRRSRRKRQSSFSIKPGKTKLWSRKPRKWRVKGVPVSLASPSAAPRAARSLNLLAIRALLVDRRLKFERLRPTDYIAAHVHDRASEDGEDRKSRGPRAARGVRGTGRRRRFH